MKIQTHACERANNRCHKKISADGKSICRVPSYPTSHTCSYREVRPKHTAEAFKLLQKLSLATDRSGVENGYDVCPELRGGDFLYPADSGEHLSL